MAKDDVHYKFRLPRQLNDRLEASAEENGRSKQAEIIARLECSYLIVKPELFRGATPELISLIRSIVMEALKVRDDLDEQ